MPKSEAPDNRIYKYFSQKAGLRASFANLTLAVGKMQSMQNTYPVASLAVGRAMAAAALLANHLGDDEHSVSLHFKGDGPLKSFYAEGWHHGGVRGYAQVPQVQLADGSDISVGRAIGHGQLFVTRVSPNMKTPQQGVVDLQTGEVADDVAYFLNSSYQIPSVVSLGVHINEYGKVNAAAGIIIELLPGAPEETIALLESNIKTAPPISQLVLEKQSVDRIIDIFLGGIPDLKQLDCQTKIDFHCRCSKKRVLNALQLLPIEELEEIVGNKNESTEVHCEFCNQGYSITLEEFKKIILKRSPKKPSLQ